MISWNPNHVLTPWNLLTQLATVVRYPDGQQDTQGFVIRNFSITVGTFRCKIQRHNAQQVIPLSGSQRNTYEGKVYLEPSAYGVIREADEFTIADDPDTKRLYYNRHHRTGSGPLPG